jgi:hypothetical protein
MNIGWQRTKNGLRGGGACLLPLALLCAPMAAMDHPSATPFVRASGTAFTIGGVPFYVTGVNNHYLTFASQGPVVMGTNVVEGNAKAVLTGLAGSQDGLGTEGRYVREVLPRAVVNDLKAALRGQAWAARRAGAIIAGFVLTAFAYARTRLGGVAETHTRYLFSRLRREGA